MQNYPSHIESKLGFDTIREHLKQACVTESGRARVDQLRISAQFDEIRKWLTETSELKDLIIQGNRPPEIEFVSVEDAVKLSGIEGSMLSLEQLGDVHLILLATHETLKYLKQFRAEIPTLYQKYEHLEVNRELLGLLDQSLDERGQLKDTASKDLHRIRKSIVRCEQQARNKLTQYFGEARQSGYTPEGSSITIRSGRLVLPVLSEHKRKIKGLVQDVSSTGGTFFIEPEAVLELNNELREWQHKEQREINRILLDLTSRIRLQENIEQFPEFLAQIDFIRAKARYAIRTDSVCRNYPINQWATGLMHVTPCCI